MSWWIGQKYKAVGQRQNANFPDFIYPYEMHFWFTEEKDITGKIMWDAVTLPNGKSIDAQENGVMGNWTDEGTVSFKSDWCNADGNVKTINYEGTLGEDHSFTGTYSCEDGAGDGEIIFVLNTE